ncbi:O-antigen ligase family protein [Desulfococcaceae bacterium HSG7]|nr:O-antigen ligase family protein [Desulfococcaceae bacterium HSG7]
MTDFALKQAEITMPAHLRTESDRHTDRPLYWLGVMVFILLAAPKMRIMIGPAPLYIIDGLIFLLLLSAWKMPAVKRSSSNHLPALVFCYLMFIYIGELRGLVIYQALFKSIYMMGVFSLGVSVFFIVPKLVRDTEAMTVVLKAIVIGLLCTSTITIMYSLSLTRPLVMKTMFSYDFLVPSAESLARRTLVYGGVVEAMRGNSLIGTSTITTGFLGTVWAFACLAANWPGIVGAWRIIANIVSIATPVAILMTYGRAAWLTVIVIGTMFLFFGFVKSRRNTLILSLCLLMVAIQFGWKSNLFMVERVVKKTRLTLENPFKDESFVPRLLSFTQPFSHVWRHPSWLIAGAGRVGHKISAQGNRVIQLRELAGLSKHSGFGMAYYCYGMAAAIIHALLMFNGLRLILRRLRRPPLKEMPLYKITWQAFLMAWCGLFFWWLPGHAMVGEARGVILFFFFYGFMMACDRIFTVQENETIKQ